MIFSSENTPTFTVTLNGGNNYTKVTGVSVAIASASDLDQVSIAISSSCNGAWQSYQSNKTVTLPNLEAVHTISVKVRSKDGFESDCVKSTITYDKTPPTIGTLSLVSNRSLLNQSARLNPPTVTDALSGLDKYEIKLVQTTGSTILKDWAVKPKDLLYFDQLTLPDAEAEVYYYIIRATDKAGNVSDEVVSPGFIAGPIVTISAPYNSYNQENTMGTVNFNISRAIASSVTVSAKAISGNALAGIDFFYPDVVPEQITIPAGQTSAQSFFSILSKTAPDSSKNFDIQITSSTNAASTSPTFNFTITNTEGGSGLTPAIGYKALSGFRGHMCALTTANKLECWGASPLDNGLLTGVNTPTEVAGLTNISSISTGTGAHTCAIDNLGDLRCFGNNSNTQLGNGNTTSTATPYKVALANVKKVTTGIGYTCVIDANDKVLCWGDNNNYALGQAFYQNYTTPTQFADINKALDITAGGKSTCAIDEVTPGTRTVKCWGRVGTGTSIGGSGIVITGIPNDISKISINGSSTEDYRHGCGTTDSGRIFCWGHTARSRRATTTSFAWNVANEVIIGPKALKVLVGTDNACAIGEDLALYCWGLGAPSTNTTFEIVENAQPVKIANMGEDITDFVLTESIGCAITVSTKIKCWGSNVFGEAGNGKSGIMYRVIALNPGKSTEKFTQLATGQNSTCGLRTNKTVTCWGNNTSGQLGTGNNNTWTAPSFTLPLTGIKKITGSRKTYCALDEAGLVYCWGDNSQGQVGINTAVTSIPTPTLIPAVYPSTAIAGLVPGTKDIAMGGQHACAVTATGTVKCWGNNSYRQTGQGDNTQYWTYAADVPNLTNVESVSAGYVNSCAVSSNATTKSIYCWGSTDFQIAGTFAGGTSIPVLIATLTTTKEVKVSVGYEAACYTHDGSTKCWGFRSSQYSLPVNVAAGTTVTTPTDVPQLAGATKIVFSVFSACATFPTGIKCWGVDISGFTSSTGQYLTLPSNAYSFNYGKAVDIGIGYSEATSVAMHACGITSLGDLKCWGYSYFGEGNDSAFIREPTYVLK